MTTRVLPREEWHRLAATDLSTVWAHLPDTTRVIVVEDDGVIVGCVTGMLILHAEGLWIAPAYRKRVTVWRQLVSWFWRVADEFGCEGALTAAVNDDMRMLLARLHATPLPGDHFYMPKEQTVCRLS